MTNRNEAPASTGGDGPSYALALQHGARTNCSTAARPRDGKKLSEKVRRDNSVRCLIPALLGHFIDRHGRASMVSAMVTGVDRSRKVASGRIARKPAPMLVLCALTVKMTVKICGAASSHLRINSLEGSLMIEWE